MKFTKFSTTFTFLSICICKNSLNFQQVNNILVKCSTLKIICWYISLSFYDKLSRFLKFSHQVLQIMFSTTCFFFNLDSFYSQLRGYNEMLLVKYQLFICVYELNKTHEVAEYVIFCIGAYAVIIPGRIHRVGSNYYNNNNYRNHSRVV